MEFMDTISLTYHKIVQQTLEGKTQLYIYIYIQQTMVTANNYMFRPLTGHYQVVHPMKTAQGDVQYTYCIL